jgi:hypothetical protein
MCKHPQGPLFDNALNFLYTGLEQLELQVADMGYRG